MRNETIEKLRVFAIIIVVLGHSIIIFDPNWGIYTTNNKCEFLYILKQFINIIQMPIFFAISGFLFYNTCEKYKFLKLCKEKIIRIIIPFIVVTLFWLIPIRLIANYQPFLDSGYLGAIEKVFCGIDSRTSMVFTNFIYNIYFCIFG